MVDLDVLLLDRDGTIALDTEHPYGDYPITFLPGVIEALRKFRDAGFKFFVVTNQARISMGTCTMEEFQTYFDRMKTMLKEEGIEIAGSRFCPHTEEYGCTCRKPKTGMWESLKDEFAFLVPEKCLMVGDKDKDIQFGKNIGSPTARLVTGQYPRGEKADYTVKSWEELADLILHDA